VNPFFTALREGGPWAVLFLVVVAVIGGLLFAFSRGILVRGGEVDRIERRIEKDTDRVLDLYRDQIKTLLEANGKKDETIASQDRQIEKLIGANETATVALDKIVREAERRGFFQTQA
jgi:hypothetical protein